MPNTPADNTTTAVREALERAHPRHVDADELSDLLDITPAQALAALHELEGDGIVTPSDRTEDAVWSLHGPARQAAYDQQGTPNA